MMVGEKISVSS